MRPSVYESTRIRRTSENRLSPVSVGGVRGINVGGNVVKLDGIDVFVLELKSDAPVGLLWSARSTKVTIRGAMGAL